MTQPDYAAFRSFSKNRQGVLSTERTAHPSALIIHRSSFSPLSGMLADRFGVSWMIIAES